MTTTAQSDSQGEGGANAPPSKTINFGQAYIELSAHILPTSATMIGVCLTALYISMLGSAGAARMLVDKLLAVDALVFLVSAALSFLSLRRKHSRQLHEEVAEVIFLAGLGILVLVAIVLAFVVN